MSKAFLNPMTGINMRRFLLFLMFIPCAFVATAGSQLRQGLDVSAPFAPTIVPTSDGQRLSYELHLTNVASRAITIEGVTITDPRSERTVAVLEGARLKAALGKIHDPASIGYDRVEPGTRAILYIDIPASTGEPVARLSHTIDFIVTSAQENLAHAVVTTTITISPRVLPIFGPPLRGGPWIAVYAPEMPMGHRRYVYALDGKAIIPGRHAIDWMKPISATGVDSGLGAEVLAVADGRIIAVRTDMAQPAQDAPHVDIPLEDTAGNYIALDVGGGNIALYEHLLPGISFKPGDSIRKGQVIGRLGATGQVTQPHLHFSLSNNASPLMAESVPYRIDRFRPLGRYESIGAFAEGSDMRVLKSGEHLTGRYPAPMLVVEFEH